MMNGAGWPVRRRPLASCEVVRPALTDHLSTIPRWIGSLVGIKAMNRDIDNDTGEAHCTLAELVQDPLIGLVMKSDGVDRHSIELLFERLAQERPRAATQRGAAASRRRAP
jgi:hypothetical protein